MDLARLDELEKYPDWWLRKYSDEPIRELIAALREAWVKIEQQAREIDALTETLQDAWLVAKAQQ